jgi:hypothetical protein
MVTRETQLLIHVCTVCTINYSETGELPDAEMTRELSDLCGLLIANR